MSGSWQTCHKMFATHSRPFRRAPVLSFNGLYPPFSSLDGKSWETMETNACVACGARFTAKRNMLVLSLTAKGCNLHVELVMPT